MGLRENRTNNACPPHKSAVLAVCTVLLLSSPPFCLNLQCSVELAYQPQLTHVSSCILTMPRMHWSHCGACKGESTSACEHVLSTDCRRIAFVRHSAKWCTMRGNLPCPNSYVCLALSYLVRVPMRCADVDIPWDEN